MSSTAPELTRQHRKDQLASCINIMAQEARVDTYAIILQTWINDACEAIDQQAKRLQELEAELDPAGSGCTYHAKRIAELEKVLTAIVESYACGCVPCRGQCVSQEALQITLDEIRDIAQEALSKQV